MSSAKAGIRLVPAIAVYWPSDESSKTKPRPNSKADIERKYRLVAKRILTAEGHQTWLCVEWTRTFLATKYVGKPSELTWDLRWQLDYRLGEALRCAELGCPSVDFASLRREADRMAAEINGLEVILASSSIDVWPLLLNEIFAGLVSIDREILNAVVAYEI